MLDLAEVDRQLGALGPAPYDLDAWAALHTGPKLSLGELDQALAELAAGVAPAAAPPDVLKPLSERPGPVVPRPVLAEPSLRDTLVEHPSLNVEPPGAEGTQPSARGAAVPPGEPPTASEPLAQAASMLPLSAQATDDAPELSFSDRAESADESDDDVEMLLEDEELLEIEDEAADGDGSA